MGYSPHLGGLHTRRYGASREETKTHTAGWPLPSSGGVTNIPTMLS